MSRLWHVNRFSFAWTGTEQQRVNESASLTPSFTHKHTRTKCYKDLAILDSSLISHSHSKTSAHAYTHTPWTQDILALRCQLSCYLVFKVSDWATDSPLFYRSDFHTSPHWCQPDLVTFHSPSVIFFFCKPPRENSVFSIANQRSFLESEAYLFHHKRKTTRRSVTFSWKLHHHGRYLQSCKAWNVK